MKTAQLIISRNRVGTDGRGIRTLVSFAGCPLNCRYCINPHLKREIPEEMRHTPESLFRRLEEDRHYFLATGGGVTFSGGEPLLHADFIEEFCSTCSPGYSVNIETSLHAPWEAVIKLLPYIHTWIVDIKSLDPDVYEAYTGREAGLSMENLRRLHCELTKARPQATLVVRLPEIPDFVDAEQADRDAEKLGQILPDAVIDRFCYVKGRFLAPEPDGRKVCRVMKAVRRALLECNGLPCTEKDCESKTACAGTCPACELATHAMNRALENIVQIDYDCVMDSLDEDILDALDYEPLTAAFRSLEGDGILMGEAISPYPYTLDGMVEPYNDVNLEDKS